MLLLLTTPMMTLTIVFRSCSQLQSLHFQE